MIGTRLAAVTCEWPFGRANRASAPPRTGVKTREPVASPAPENLSKKHPGKLHEARVVSVDAPCTRSIYLHPVEMFAPQCGCALLF